MTTTIDCKSVVCPKCHAAIGVQCLEPHTGKTGISGTGSTFIKEFHKERFEIAKQKQLDIWGDARI